MIAQDAYVIDTTGVSIEKVVARILSIVQEQF
jgi:cytidylate kinase